MKVFLHVKEFWQKQSFINIPKELVASFERSIFFVNMKRLAIQSFAIVVVNVISLLLYYIYYYNAGYVFWSHLFVHVLQIFLFGGIFSVFYKNRKNFRGHGFFEKNIDLIYESAFVAMEILLFAAGPGDISAYLRLLAASFVIGVVPVISAKRAFYMQFLLVFFCFLYLPRQSSIYWTFEIKVALNLMVVLVVANLLSGIAYSFFVENFLRHRKDRKLIKELSMSRQKLKVLNNQDQLTGLNRQRAFNIYMKLSWEQEKEKNSEINIIIFDIDFMREYNDNFGYFKGDECIAQVGQAIKRELDLSQYMLSRIGGERFVAVSYNKDNEEVVRLAEHIRNSIEQLKIENPESEVSAFMTASAGITTQPMQDFTDYKEVVDIADTCRHLAKQNGRNQIVYAYYKESGYRTGYNKLLNIKPNKSKMIKTLTSSSENIEQAIKEVSADCSFIYYRKDQLFEFSEKAVELLGVPRRIEHPTLDKFAVFVAKEDRSDFLEHAKKCIDGQEVFFDIDTVIETPDGRKVSVSIHSRYIYNEEGKLEVVAGDIIIMHNLLKYSKFIQQQSDTDSITMLPNHKLLQRVLAQMLKKMDNFGQVIILEMKEFEVVNKLYGHSISDRLLKEVACLLGDFLSVQHTLYSYYTDYVIILEQKEQQTAQQLMHNIKNYFEYKEIKIKGLSFKISFAMGTVGWQTEGMNVEELLLALNVTITKARENPEVSIAFFTEKDMDEYLAKLRLEKQIIQAAEEDFTGFMVYYQPIICAQKHRIVGAEALLRWKDADNNIISPAIFVPILEKTGLIATTERWLFEQVAKQCSEWLQKKVEKDFFAQINISTLQIARPTLAQELIESICRYSIAHQNIVLEVTEGSLIMEMQQAIKTLSDLRKQGIKIAVDDFGTGYSSLSYLRLLPVDEIKIDRSFVKNIEKDFSAKEFLSSIIHLSKSTGKTVCVEGVETNEQSNILKELQVNFMQGFLFAKPLPVNEFYEKYFEFNGCKKLYN